MIYYKRFCKIIIRQKKAGSFTMSGKRMTEGTPWKQILLFALPVLAGSLLQQLYNTVDTIVVGNFAGEESLSAVGTTGTLTFLMLAVAMGISAGNGVVVAQFYGAEKEKKVRQAASTGIILMMLLGIVTTIAGLALSRIAFQSLVAVPEEILSLTLLYFRIYVAGIIFQYGYNIFSSILRAVGDSKATLYFLLISSVLNVVLDLLFVALFHWGVAGAAVATVISQAVSFVAAYIYMIRKYPVFRFSRTDFTWNSQMAKSTILVGFPIALQLIIVSVGLTFIQRVVNSFGKTMTASFTVGNRIEMYLNLPCSALQTTMATYTGQNIGAGKINRVKQGVRQSAIMSLLMSCCIAVVAFLFVDQIISLFGIGPDAMVYCRQHIRAISLINLILSAYMPMFGVFQGAGHGGIPTLVATCALSLRVVVTYLFRYSVFFGYSIVWWNGLFGFTLGFIITWSYYLSGKWKHNSKLVSEL